MVLLLRIAECPGWIWSMSSSQEYTWSPLELEGLVLVEAVKSEIIEGVVMILKKIAQIYECFVIQINYRVDLFRGCDERYCQTGYKN